LSDDREIKRAIARDARSSFAFGAAALIVMFVGGCMFVGASGTLPVWASTIGFGLQVAGTALLVVGLGFYARKRGHSIVLGGLGLLSWLGIIIVAAVPKRCRRCRTKVRGRASACGECGTPA
jgi:hypothetical protein